MNALYNNGEERAFPGRADATGMSLLDWFAGRAMQTIVGFGSGSSPQDLAKCSYQVARAMMRERDRKENE